MIDGTDFHSTIFVNASCSQQVFTLLASASPRQFAQIQISVSLRWGKHSNMNAYMTLMKFLGATTRLTIQLINHQIIPGVSNEEIKL